MADESPPGPAKMQQAAFQPTRLLSGRVVSWLLTQPNGIFTDFFVNKRCSISTTDFLRDGRNRVGWFLFQWTQALIWPTGLPYSAL